MRINSQNNQFVFNLPQSVITKEIDEKFQILLDKNFIPYHDVIDYINSTIKDVVFPSLSFDVVEQRRYHGKKTTWREAGNIADKFAGQLDITFRSVDSHLNYFIIMEICTKFYLNDDPNYIDFLSIDIIDKDGDLIYTILFKQVLFSSLSENRLSYSATEFVEHTFTLQFTYNYIDIIWKVDRDELVESSVFDTEIIHDPLAVERLEAEMVDRKEISYNRIGK